MNMIRATRRQLFRWIGWFGVTNAALFALVAQRYLWIYHFPDDGLGIAYASLTFVGHFTLLSLVPMLIVLTPFVVAIRSRRLIQTLGVIIAASGLSLLFLDTMVFDEHRFHLGVLSASLFEFSTWAFVGVMFLILLAFEAMLAGIIWRNFALAEGPKHGGKLAVVLLGCWLASQAIHIWGDAVGHTPVTQFTRFMPLYYPIHAKRDLARLGLVDPEAVRHQRMLRGSLESANGQLNYPLKPLNCNAADADLPNIVIILIDALRPDAIDPELTPTLTKFRDDAVRFDRHYSGGNSSRMGLFSMFYGLPSTYWQGFYDSQRAPVLMDEIRARGYDAGLFSAVGFGSPALIDRTAFAGWPNLKEKRQDLSATERNELATTNWTQWLDQQSGDKPLFGFIYYDPPADEMTADPAESLPMDDRFTQNDKARKLWRQYRLAIRMLDGEVRTVLDSLRDRGIFDESIVIVTSDHGYEFDDNGIGHYGHASNFSTVQLRSTLMMHWPGKPARAIDDRTTHHDLPVTLLQDVFGCKNPPGEYSVGRNLFSGESWDWMMAGSYTSHAIVEPGRVIVSHPGGFVEVLGSDYRPVQDKSLNAQLIQDSLEAQRRFLK
jgi:membrane-anchored protein YejM (alkaline phosphatase superfamily)